jgi:hypothetical protein
LSSVRRVEVTTSSRGPRQGPASLYGRALQLLQLGLAALQLLRRGLHRRERLRGVELALGFPELLRPVVSIHAAKCTTGDRRLCYTPIIGEGAPMHINFDGPWVLILYLVWVSLVLFVVSIIVDVW